MKKLICLILILSFSTAGCHRPSAKSPADGRLQVVVTTSMVGDLVRNVAGEFAEVTGLMGEGVDPHLYRPTSRDLARLMQADVIFYSGLGLEGAMQSAFERIEKSGKAVVPVTAGIPEDALIFSERFSGHPDPHLWNDAGLWRKCLDQVVEVLSQADPEHSQQFMENAARYGEEIEQMDRYAKESLGSIPEEVRFLVTAHDAFSYFARAYGLSERSVQGITTESEPGVQDVNQLVDFLVKQKVPALFVEATVSSGHLRAVIEGARQRGWEVKEGGTLFSDSTGAPGTYEGTYLGMFDHNVTTVTRALGGTAPERGFAGRLKEKGVKK